MPFWRSNTTPNPDVDQQHPESMHDNNAAASASQAAGTEWLSGHLNHLTDEQEGKLSEFKKLCQEKGYYQPAGEGKKESHGDATMLFDVNAAWGQFKDTEDWRKDNAIESLYENIDVDSYEAARRMYPQWTGRRDRRGIPIYVFEIKHLNAKNMAAYNETLSTNNLPAEAQKSSSVPERLLRLFALYENLLRFVVPVCSLLKRPNPETPIVTSTNIVDVSGVGLKQFWNLKGHMQDASVLATAHYPETLDRIFIIGAPSFFPTVWSWIKRWFDPVTTSKIFILTVDQVKPTLLSFMDPSSIPKQYGGELDWAWGDMPNLDDDARELIGGIEKPANGKGYVKGPMLFDDDQSKIEVLGKEGGEQRRYQVGVNKGKERMKEQVEIEEKGGADAAAPAVPADGGAAAEKKDEAAANGSAAAGSSPAAATS